MSGLSDIEWTDATWNPTTGCDRVSPGCDNCYALTQAKRLKAMGSARYQTDGDSLTSGPGFGIAEHPDALDWPLRKTKPLHIFVNSMSDLWHPGVSPEFVEQVFRVMRQARQHTFQILTKRPQRMSAHFAASEALTPGGAPIPHVWLGTSIESKQYCFRADRLRETPAAVRFLSLEPLLGPIPGLDLSGIDWVIVGGESGVNARPVDVGWVRDIRDQCLETHTKFFFKQWGGRTAKAGGRVSDGRTWDEMPSRGNSATPRDVSPKARMSLHSISYEPR